MPEKCDIRDCPMGPRVEALEEANRQHGRTHEGMYDRIRALETENAVQNAHWKNVDAKLDDLTAMVRDLTGKAGKRWDSVVEKALMLLVGGIAAMVLARLGLTA